MIPTDSTESRELREANAERDALESLPHDDRCAFGWLGEDEAGRPIACPTCRPHVARGRRRLEAQLHGPTVMRR